MTYRVLGTWDQVAPRAYIRLWYCFPCEETASLNDLKEYLKPTLSTLSEIFPDLKGRISLLSNPPGCLAISSADDTAIPLKASDQRDTYGWTYSKLKSQGFPAKAFIGESFDPSYRLVEGQPGIPSFEINIRLIKGGLLLGIYGHHSIFDAGHMHTVIKAFAKLTNNNTRMVDIATSINPNTESRVVENDVTEVQPAMDFEELLSRCPEYRFLSYPLGPTQFRVPESGMQSIDIQNTGRIFVIEDQLLYDLKKELTHVSSINSQTYHSSTFTCLTAITWAHVTKARLSSNGSLSSLSSTEISFPKEARLMISVDWRRRISTNAASNSAGNTIALPIASVRIQTILAACNSDRVVACSALADIVLAIEQAVLSVDDDFVALRTALFCASPDLRLIGLDFDLCDPLDFYFNTWRHFGTQTSWGLPGLANQELNGGFTADAIRRAQASFANGAGLVLPATDRTGFEIVLTLDINAMELLCTDPSWLHWVEHTVY
ncbi:hypothetical protein FVEN_g9609 [Fusarium venenatum]|uniref:Trichothecene 3-O-acetyltransferase-like N-terminal domain-containing protein n=2 Tax=Fusarium venenatum TaxID=56646 RepID=A0A2L2U1B1_9HYPO|nr:uncharacterized protein FVRRES_04317 [Fusarium venenatum]KAG8352404.1 hypothetical protein FVEN_g9609 [Fusarium venenatum]CEI67805.1 unnamed protein product [Fusarium venenatum]